MLQNFDDMLNSAVHVKEGMSGHLEDILFDVEKWVARYAVIRIGTVLTHKIALIPMSAVARMDWEKHVINLHFTREQVEECPSIDRFNLPSLRAICDYHVEAKDSRFGLVDDFLIDDTNWTIKYVLLEINNWWPSRPVLISPESVRLIDSDNRILTVDLTRREIESS